MVVRRDFKNNVKQIISAKKLEEFYHKVAEQLGDLNLNGTPSDNKKLDKQLDFPSEVLSESEIFKEHIATRLKKYSFGTDGSL